MGGCAWIPAPEVIWGLISVIRLQGGLSACSRMIAEGDEVRFSSVCKAVQGIIHLICCINVSGASEYLLSLPLLVA